MIVIYQQYFDFIRYSVNSNVYFIPDIKGMDWHGLYEFSCEQAIVGVVFEGVKRLGNHGMKPPFDILMKWLAIAEQIAAQNRLLFQECCRLTQIYESEGHKTAILKGQANARLYQNPLSRQSGDIDLYMDGGEKKVINTLLRLGIIDRTNIGKFEGESHASKNYHHVHLPTNENRVDVEIHFRPSSGVCNPFANRKLQKYLENEIKTGCMMVDDGFRVPSFRFALVMQMAHIQKHLMDEGVGLRQIIDYYYLLTYGDRYKMDDVFKKFGLYNTATAVMWILRKVLGLDENRLIAPTDERRGRMLLREIITGGSFGKYAGGKQRNGLRRFFYGRKRHLKLLRFDFKETIWFELKYLKMQIEKTIVRVRRRSWTV